MLYTCMEKQVLQDLIDQGLTQIQMADRTGRSQTSIRHWLAKYNLKTKWMEGSHCCRECGETDPAKFYKSKKHSCRTICWKCKIKKNNDKIKGYRKAAVDYKGGQCSVCSYSRCLAALEFHHLVAGEKDPKWKTLRRCNLDTMKRELDKCVLVCSNCHREIHAGLRGSAEEQFELKSQTAQS